MQASAVINAHREGALLVPTLRSLICAREHAKSAGHDVQFIMVLDNPDRETTLVVDSFKSHLDLVFEVRFKDLGASREYGIEQTSHEHVFLHDGDDLYSRNWYCASLDGLQSGDFDPETVYHTNLFIGFQNQKYFREMVESTNPLFDPLFLCSEWYFSNKCMVPKSLFKRHPMPRNNISKGIGNEDWTWSGTTIACGVEHRIVPYTACLYRHKPQEESLGLVAGMIHGPSELYMPSFVNSLAQKNLHKAIGSASYNVSSLNVIRDYAAESYPHPWVWQELHRQAAFEPLLTDLFGLPEHDKVVKPPNFHFNVASAYRDICKNLDDNPKIFLFFSERNIQGADFLIEKVIADIRKAANVDTQMLAIIDDDEQEFDERYFFDRYNCKIVSIRRLRNVFRLEDWYFYRFLARLFVQFRSVLVLDFCSDVFAQMFSEFERPICSLHARISFVYPNATFDPFSRSTINLKSNISKYTSFRQSPPVVFSMAESRRRDEMLREVTVPIPGRAGVLWRAFLRERFSRFPKQRIKALNKISIAPLLSSSLQMDERCAASDQLSKLHNPISRKSTRISGFSVISTGHAWFSKSLLPLAVKYFLDAPKVIALVPQILTYQEGPKHAKAMWIDYHNIRDHLASLIDFTLINKIIIPFFIFCRKDTQLYATLRSINSESETATITVIRSLLNDTVTHQIAPIERSLCIGTRITPLKASHAASIVNAAYVQA